MEKEIEAIEERESKELELMNENENREFYVYVHIRKDNNTVFYVGKGTKNRAHNLDRGSFHNGVRDKYGCKVVIIKDNLTESQAFRLESKMIKYYVLALGYGAPIDGYRDFSNNKYLTNFTWGGEGTSGYKFSEESKRKMSEAKSKMSEETKIKMSENHADVSGEKNPMYGKNAFENKTKEEMEITRKKMSESHKGENNPLYGKYHSYEAKEKISEANSKKVVCITTGEIFDSIKEAEKYYKCGNISKCCREIRYKSAGKLNGTPLQWKYLEDYNNEFKGILIHPTITE